MNIDDLKEVLSVVDEILPPKECVTFRIEAQPTTLFDNKIGGTPYFPKDMEYPTFNDKPLILLAQINFSTFKPIEGFPDKGIMQVYIADEDCYGMDWDDNTSNTSFRVIYHEDIIEDPDKLIDSLPYEMSDDLPFKGEYLLTPNENSVMYATPYLENFDDVFVEAYNDIMDNPINDIFELEDSLVNELYDRNERAYAWIGGYPIFTQYDPRSDEKYSTLLFESDSFWNKEINIMWGDSGTGTFFISPEDLKNKDFSKILYSWDCC